MRNCIVQWVLASTMLMGVACSSDAHHPGAVYYYVSAFDGAWPVPVSFEVIEARGDVVLFRRPGPYGVERAIASGKSGESGSMAIGPKRLLGSFMSSYRVRKTFGACDGLSIEGVTLDDARPYVEELPQVLLHDSKSFVFVVDSSPSVVREMVEKYVEANGIPAERCPFLSEVAQ